MSFILDALKKSETERQRQSLPGLMDTRLVARRSRLPLWAILLGALLGITVLVLSVLLMRSVPASSANPVKHVIAESDSTGAPQSNDHFSPLSAAPVYAPEIPLPAELPRAAGRAEPRAEPRATARAMPHRADPLLSDEDTKADNEVLPSINEINSSSLPELHLDVHVYATKSAERFVYINMHKYHEGSAMPEGPLVEHIRRDGVVLDYHGLRFILPRQP